MTFLPPRPPQGGDLRSNSLGGIVCIPLGYERPSLLAVKERNSWSPCFFIPLLIFVAVVVDLREASYSLFLPVLNAYIHTKEK